MSDRAGAAIVSIAAGLTTIGCSPAPMVQQTVVDTSSSGEPVASALPVTPKPEAKTRHDDRVVRHTIGLGETRRCLVDAGRLYCWGGWKSKGSLDEPIRAHAELMKIEGHVTSVAVSPNHSCATTRQGHVWCWGSNSLGELGAGVAEDKSDEPRQVVGIDDALSVDVGRRHSCAIRRGGKVSCWGDNRSGQVGNTIAYTRQARRLVRPVEVTSVRKALDIALGDDYSCAITAAGETSCWGMFRGFNIHLRMEDDPHKARFRAEMVPASQIRANEGYGCALLDKGEVQCWGYGLGGRLGHNQGYSAVARVEQLSDAVQLATGGAHSCALLKSGEMVCWGAHGSGQLGGAIAPNREENPRPLPVQGVQGIVEIAAGGSISCARTREQKLYCWGANPWSNESGNVAKPESRRIR